MIRKINIKHWFTYRSDMRGGRQKYYDIFSNFYDFFINVHAGRHRDETRRFLVYSSQLDNKDGARVLDICCGTGSVVLAFVEKYPDALISGYDFSSEMLRKAKHKAGGNGSFFVQGDAARLAYGDDTFDIVCCSHAIYELKSETRKDALLEMKRVVKPDGKVLIMEHEVPQNPIVKLLFYLRMMTMGAADSEEFLREDHSVYRDIFPDISLSHTPSGKSKLITCRKS